MKKSLEFLTQMENKHYGNTTVYNELDGKRKVDESPNSKNKRGRLSIGFVVAKGTS